MDKVRLDAFRNTGYLVCLDPAEWACIRIDQPLPAVLQALVGDRPWGFITAWNPRSEPHEPAANLAAQRELLAALRARPDTVVYPGIGIGAGGWHEPSLFVIGPDSAVLDTLARQHGQLAYVHGHAHGTAQLRWLG